MTNLTQHFMGYCDGSYHGDSEHRDGEHPATADCTDWQSVNEIKMHKAICTDTNCECKR